MPKYVLASLAVLLAGCEEPEVSVIRVDIGVVESTVTSVEAGVVEPLRKASLASPVSGRVVRIHCAEGDRVEEGRVLIELENDIEKLRVEQTGRELERLLGMAEIAPEEELERARFTHDRARIDYDRTLIRATFPGFVADLNARLGEMTYGSFGLALTAGSSPGTQEPLIYLIDDSQLFVEAEIDETDVFRVAVGQPTTVTLGGVERRKLPAKVRSISPVVSTREGETRTAQVKVELERSAPALAAAGGPDLAGNPHEDPSISAPPSNGGGESSSSHWGKVLPGMSADIEVLVRRLENVVRVPTTAIIERGEDRHVYVVSEGRIQRRSIVTGLGNWEMTEVREGLSAGDLVVITTEARSLAEGRRVKPILEGSP